VVLDTVNGRGHAAPGEVLEVCRAGQREPALRGARHDAARDRVLRFALDGGCHTEGVVAAKPLRRPERHHPELAEGQRPGLVEDHRVDQACVFEPAAIADQESRPRAEGGGDRDDQRNCESERVRAGDDEHGHDADDGEVDRRAEQLPHDHREQRRGDGDPGQQLRRAIREHLRARLGSLGVGDQAHDFRELGIGAGAGDHDAQRALAVDRPGDDALALALLYGTGLTGDHRFVQRAGAFPNHAVHRYALTGTNEDDVLAAQIADRHPLLRAVPQPRSGVGKQASELLQRALRALDRAHLDPMAEQHDRHQRGELPPQRVAPDHAELDDPGKDEGDGDRQRDQRHHPGEPSAQLAPRAAQEGTPAIQKDGRSEQGRDPGRSRQRRRTVAQQHLDVVGPDDGGNRQHERQPETVPEHPGRVSGVRVVPAARGCGRR
jgi:hypothetical protein